MSTATLVAEVTAKASAAYYAAEAIEKETLNVIPDDYAWEDEEDGLGLWSSYYSEEGAPNKNLNYVGDFYDDSIESDYGSDTYFDYNDYEYQQGGY